MKFFATINAIIIKSTRSVSGIYNYYCIQYFQIDFCQSKEDFFHFVKELQRLRDLESEGHVDRVLGNPGLCGLLTFNANMLFYFALL